MTSPVGGVTQDGKSKAKGGKDTLATSHSVQSVKSHGGKGNNNHVKLFYLISSCLFIWELGK